MTFNSKATRMASRFVFTVFLVTMFCLLAFEGFVIFFQTKSYLDTGDISVVAINGAAFILAMAIAGAKVSTAGHSIKDYLGGDRSGGRLAGIGYIGILVAQYTFSPAFVHPSVLKIVEMIIFLQACTTLGYAASVIDVTSLFNRTPKEKKTKKKQSYSSRGSATHGAGTANMFEGFNGSN
jgi:hypothetical protein